VESNREIRRIREYGRRKVKRPYPVKVSSNKFVMVLRFRTNREVDHVARALLRLNPVKAPNDALHLAVARLRG
jgi:predicted nucleic acid-binding protein